MATDSSENSIKLYKVATELLQTEATYVERLTLINNDFHDFFVKVSKALHEKNYPTVKQIDSMFLNLGSILGFHKILLAELKDTLNNWSKEQKIGGIFKEMAPFIKLYATYISGYEETQDALQAYIRKFPKFAADLEKQQKLPQCQSLTLMHHMLEPIQRVPRYRMLLQEYKKFLPTDHKDYQDLSLSLEMVMKSADHANNSILEYEASLKLNEIQNRIISNIVIIVPGRRIIYEGELNRCSSGSTSKFKSCYAFLFNDIFLDCTYSTHKKMKQQAFYQIGCIEVSKVSGAKNGWLFEITTMESSVKYLCKTEEERDLWVTKMQKVIEELLLREKSFKRPANKKSENTRYSAGVKKIGEFLGGDIVNSIRRASVGRDLDSECANYPIFPLCDGLLDVAFDQNSKPATLFCVLSMQRKLILYSNDNEQTIIKDYDIEGYSLYKIEDTKNGVPRLHLTDDESTSVYLSNPDNKVITKWLSLLRRSGVIVNC